MVVDSGDNSENIMKKRVISVRRDIAVELFNGHNLGALICNQVVGKIISLQGLLPGTQSSFPYLISRI